MLPPRVDVLGVGISALSLDQAVAIVGEASSNPGHLGYVTVTGVHGVIESQDDSELRAIHNASFLSTPDGMPMVWVGKHAGHATMTRVYGPDLFLKVLEASVSRKERHYFFGGNDGVAQELKDRMTIRIPGLQVCGTMTPPFRPLTEEEELRLLAEINASKPHYLWVGLSTPKQERFMHAFIAKYRDRIDVSDRGLTFFGVGAAFDFYTDRVKQAPKWIQKSGLEWFFRLCTNPKRLWRRYLTIVPRFVLKIIPQLMRR